MSPNDERGLETLEFVGMFPLVILTILIVMQFLQVGRTAIIAASVAREGARACAVGRSAHEAVQAACPANMACKTEGCRSGGGDRRIVVVDVQVPEVGMPFPLGLEPPWISSKAVMRYEGRRD